MQQVFHGKILVFQSWETDLTMAANAGEVFFTGKRRGNALVGVADYMAFCGGINIPGLAHRLIMPASPCGGDVAIHNYTRVTLLLSDVTKISLFRSRLRFSTLPSLYVYFAIFC